MITAGVSVRLDVELPKMSLQLHLRAVYGLCNGVRMTCGVSVPLRSTQAPYLIQNRAGMERAHTDCRKSWGTQSSDLLYSCTCAAASRTLLHSSCTSSPRSNGALDGFVTMTMSFSSSSAWHLELQTLFKRWTMIRCDLPGKWCEVEVNRPIAETKRSRT